MINRELRRERRYLAEYIELTLSRHADLGISRICEAARLGTINFLGGIVAAGALDNSTPATLTIIERRTIPDGHHVAQLITYGMDLNLGLRRRVHEVVLKPLEANFFGGRMDRLVPEVDQRWLYAVANADFTPERSEWAAAIFDRESTGLNCTEWDIMVADKKARASTS